jgi:hypothetical protein
VRLVREAGGFVFIGFLTFGVVKEIMRQCNRN